MISAATMQRVQSGTGARFSLCKARANAPQCLQRPISKQGLATNAAALDQSKDDVAGSGNSSSDNNDIGNSLEYYRGAVWLSEPKVLAKGFKMSLTFDLDWNMARNKLSLGHPLLLLANHHPAGEQGRGDPDWSMSSVSNPTWASSSAASSVLPRDRPRTPKELLQRSLALGCVTHTFHSARQGTSVVGTTELGLDVPYSLSTGISIYATIALGNGVQYYLRVFVVASTDKTRGRLRHKEVILHA